MARVSIVIPTYNRAHLLGEAIQSALAQTHAGSEVLVVDDGSTDETAALVAGFGDAVSYLRQENAGVAAARNHGAAVATGDYLHFLDSDDVLHPQAVERLLAVMAAHPEAGMAYGQTSVGTADGPPSPLFIPDGERPTGVCPGASELRHLLRRNYIHLGAALLRRGAWERIGGFNPAFQSICEDWDVWVRAATTGAAVGYVPRVVLGYRLQPDGLTSHYNARNVERYLANHRAILDTAFAAPEVSAELAPYRAEIEAYHLYLRAWLTFSIGDVAAARRELRAALRLHPRLLLEGRSPEVRALWLKLLVPRRLTEAVRARKHTRRAPAS
jgi:glycosyltransferase involved in cell wall biosynthesis